jgi:hypothetical protein
MQVTVDIICGKQTVMDHILTPIKRATDVVFREKEAVNIIFWHDKVRFW